MAKIPPIKEYMIPNPYTVQYDDSVSAAEKMMNSHSIRHMPVVGGKKIMGIISDKDVLRARQVYKDRTFEAEVLVKDVCLLDACTVDENTPIDRVVKLMQTERVDAVAVVKNDVPCGIFTSTDAYRLIADLFRGGTCRKGFFARLFG